MTQCCHNPRLECAHPTVFSTLLCSTRLLTRDALLVGVLWALGALVAKAEHMELPLAGEHLVQARPPPRAGDVVIGEALGADDATLGHVSIQQLQHQQNTAFVESGTHVCILLWLNMRQQAATSQLSLAHQ